MARHENPPFERGQTFHGGTPTADEILAFQGLEGKEWETEDVDLTVGSGVGGGPGAKPVRSGRYVTLRIVRNVAGFPLLPKRLVSFAPLASYGRVDGYADANAEDAYPVDEFINPAGVANNDLFYIVMNGPAVVLTSLAGDVNNSIAIGDRLVALAAASSGATSAGRVKQADFTALTTPGADNIMHCLGRAMSARTTGNTNADLLVDIGHW